MCYAELGAATRKTGGTYAFLRRAFGTPFVAFPLRLDILLRRWARRDCRYFSFVEYLLFSLGVATVIILRRKEPKLERPYRVWLYALPPVVF